MKYLSKIILVAVMFAVLPQAWGANDNSNKKERNFIRQGNELYRQNNFADAEVQYRKALGANPNSEIAQFNLASALLMQANQAAVSKQGNNQGNNNDENKIKALLDSATTTLNNIAQYSTNKELSSKAFYDLGNIAYQSQNYQGAIDAYKNALRRNPDYNEARHNLRLAQLKMKQNQDQQQNKNDQNKDQNKDQDKQNQQDKDKKDQQDKNKDKDKQDQNQQQQNQNQNKQQQQPQQGMSRQNMDQVLKANQDQERATRERMNAIKARTQQEERARTSRRW